MKNIFLLFAALLFSSPSVVHSADRPIKVACVGNSITYGSGIANPSKNSYPAQLQQYLGTHYHVRNFGVSARTLMKKGNNPYIHTAEYKQSLDFEPDIVLIKLGTNDSKLVNRVHLESDFKADYAELIASYQNLPSKPRIVLLTPVRCYLGEDEFSTQSYLNVIIPALQELAITKKCEIINLHSLFNPTWESHIMPDKLHPSSIGAGMIAHKVGRYLTYPSNAPDAVNKLPYAIDETFNFHGYKGYKFKAVGAQCVIVEPKFAAKGNPWVWRARFWGHEPQTDIALLENGFHLAYCDVADLYGAPGAVERWNRFYKLVARPIGLNPKVALEGMSRGGLIIYNWAAANTTKVACIYADAPVMDFKSWPMGEGESDGSADDTKNLLTAYGFAEDNEALAWKKNPLDHAKKLAKAGIPMLHVVGDADNIVPVAENTELFEKTVKANGGDIRVIHKPNVGHHPHSLESPTEIVNFILRSTGHLENACVRPVPGNEYRSAAGWREGSDWHVVSEEISAILGREKLDILLLGNSITQGFGGSRECVTYKPGKQIADSLFKGLQWESAGISGDRTQNLLWRLQNGNYDAAKPSVVVITIGINNLNGDNDAGQTAAGVIAVAQQALESLPQTRIILLGPLPAGASTDSPLRERCDGVQTILAKTKFDPRITYINPTEWFVNQDGDLKEGYYGGDDLHLTSLGYAAWCAELSKLVVNAK